MSYMVMETNRAFAVVLDSGGRFLKAANLNYQVGDVLDEVVPLLPPAPVKKTSARTRLVSLLAAAACFAALLFGAYQQNFAAYGTVRVQINPDVLLTVSRSERVLRLDGLNADGSALIDGYKYRGHSQNQVTAELVERAADMGYVSNGGQVCITLSGAAPWQSTVEQALIDALQSSVRDVALTVYLSSQGESEPHSAVATAPESEYWKSSVGDVQPTIPALAQFGGELGEFGVQTGLELGEWGVQTGLELGEWGIQTGLELGEWGIQTGLELGEWGIQTGQRLEEWGIQTGRQLEETLSDEKRWANILENGIASGGVGGIVSEILKIF